MSPAKWFRGAVVLWGLLAACGLVCLRSPGARADVEPDDADLTVSSDTKEFTNSVGMKFVPVGKGKFKMGAPAAEKDRAAEEHFHDVEITKDFFLGAHEVTQKQYEKVIGSNPSTFSKGGTGAARVRGLDTADFPVDNVSHNDAVKFVEKLNAREAKKPGWKYALPTEAQWEYACRGGADSTTKPFRFEKPSDSISSDQANFNGSPYPGGGPQGKTLGRTCKVGSYKPNNLGLYDMHGNLWEWCADWFSADYGKTGPLRDPPGPDKGTQRVLKSACHFNSGWECRAARRHPQDPGFKNEAVGFRVAYVQDN